MSPTISRMWIRSDNGENTGHNPCAKSRAVSTSICKIKCIAIKLLCKPNDTIRLYFENANGLPTSKSGCHSEKVSHLRQIWSKLNVDFTPLVKTQINPSLIPNKESSHATVFQNYADTSILSNNTNELIGRRQQGIVMTIVKRDIVKCATST